MPTRLKELRQGRHWTQRELALWADVSPALVSRYERGDVSPTGSALAKLAAALGVDAGELGLVPEQASPPRPRYRIRELMDARDMTYSELVRRSGVSGTTLSNLLHGRSEAVDATGRRLAKALGVTPAELVNRGSEAPTR